MGRLFKQYLNGPKVYSCSGCRTHLADHEDIISKAFQGRHGRAFLFSSVVNTTMGPKEERLLMTGLHTVADIQCTCCNTVLGWKYEQAFEESQKYKEGKYILEKAKVMKEDLDDEEEPEDNEAMHPPPRVPDVAPDQASRRPRPRAA